jgi:hypothetical protein
MSTTSRTFYSSALTNEQEKQILIPLNVGSIASNIKQLYADKQLKKQIGNLQYTGTLLNTSKEIPIYEFVATINTEEGSIKYQYIRDSYDPVTIETELVSGIFKKGTLNLSYITSPDKRVCKLVYRSAE